MVDPCFGAIKIGAYRKFILYTFGNLGVHSLEKMEYGSILLEEDESSGVWLKLNNIHKSAGNWNFPTNTSRTSLADTELDVAIDTSASSSVMHVGEKYFGSGFGINQTDLNNRTVGRSSVLPLLAGGSLSLCHLTVTRKSSRTEVEAFVLAVTNFEIVSQFAICVIEVLTCYFSIEIVLTICYEGSDLEENQEVEFGFETSEVNVAISGWTAEFKWNLAQLSLGHYSRYRVDAILTKPMMDGTSP
ncbi:hypothetical protein Tco_0705377 [Tanacetum coccineum]|uniref:Uncharacterized protein n=1 Tax=Tanacetum coccineum TaxID=301880 RepID=A0ABQ4Y4K8_9ASTR